MTSTTRMVATLFNLLNILAAGSALAQQRAAGTPAAPDNSYVPPACSGIFTDVACPGGFAVNWIEQFYNDGITAGCTAAPLQYCPDAAVTRAQMAVFVEKAMRGTGTWGPGDMGSDNTGVGLQALVNNSKYAMQNTAVGAFALYTQSFTNGNSGYFPGNTGIGVAALFSTQPDGGSGGLNGTLNTAVGYNTLYNNATGYGNSAFGWAASSGTTTGFFNTAVGMAALQATTTGFDNTALGWKAGARGGDSITGYTGSPIVLVSNGTGSYNTFVSVAGATAQVNNCTAVGMDAYCDGSDQVRLGNFFVGSIGGKVGWSALSDARAKSDIRDLDLGLDLVLALRPVSFRYNGGNGRTDMGFVAQDVEALLGDEYNVLGIGGDRDRTLSLRYTDLIAPMVKAIQEQQATIEAQQAQIEGLKTALAERDSALERRLARLERKTQ